VILTFQVYTEGLTSLIPFAGPHSTTLPTLRIFLSAICYTYLPGLYGRTYILNPVCGTAFNHSANSPYFSKVLYVTLTYQVYTEGLASLIPFAGPHSTTLPIPAGFLHTVKSELQI
ncbi:MAG: hypothetical protein R6W90_15780, partial [Ignavibacteriaceae bacterium]